MITHRLSSGIVALLLTAAAGISVAQEQRGGCTVAIQPTMEIAEEPIDVFLIAGQSNAMGIPDNADVSPRLPARLALQYYNGRVTTANDPVGNAQPGSAWPEFGLIYNEKTHHRALFVPASVPASSMTAAGDFFKKGHWDDSGNLFAAATAEVDDALKVLGPQYRLAGVLWSQGENDGLAIDIKFETPAEYKIALEKLIDRFRTRYGAQLPFFIFETGVVLNKPPEGFAAVRGAQVQVARESSANAVVFDEAVTFPAQKLMARSGAHYSQEGYNRMGQEGASAVAAYFHHFAAAECK